MKSIYVSILAGIIMLAVTSMFLALAIIRIISNQYDIALVKADREHWRLMASSPEWLCRARGGEYKLESFETDFTSSKTTWSCIGDKH